MIPGISGPLLSTSFLAAKLAAARPIESTSIARSASAGPASSLRALLEAGAAPLLDALGLGTPADIEITSHLLAATVPSGDQSIALLVVRWGEPLPLHWRAGIEHATQRAGISHRHAVRGNPQRRGDHPLSDRVGAVGGTFSVESAPGKGTKISGRIPLN